MPWNTAKHWNAPLSRRSVLRGAGAVVALPFLESWAWKLARAEGTSTKTVRPPLRMGIFTVAGGTVLESWRMPQGGPLPEKLPSILRPLAFARDQLLVLTGLSHRSESENTNGHQYCGYTHLTAAPKVRWFGGKAIAGISVDQAAANAVGHETALASIEMGLSNHETQYSFRSADQSVPYEADPRLVFERMFRGRQPIVPNWQRRSQARQSQSVRESKHSETQEQGVLDAVRQEAQSLRGKLGGQDRHKLDQYLESVQSLESRIERVERLLLQEAEDLRQPGPSHLIQPQLPDAKVPFYAFRNQVYRDPEAHAEYIRLMSDLMVLAFQTDTTRVVTLAVGDDGAYFPGVITVGYEYHCHTLEHQGNNGDRPELADPISREACRQIHAWYTSLFAETVRKLQAIDEGGSTLLDNTLLLYTSYMADGGHGTADYPVCLVGGAQGTLCSGRQFDFPKQTPMANLYVEMLDRMGAHVDEFGNSRTSPHAAFDGRLPGLV